MSTKVDEFAAVLPALQHMARFRGANREVVCRQRGVNPVALESVVAEVFGSWAHLDEESLEEIAAKLGVTVPPYEALRPGFIQKVIEAEKPPVRMGRPAKAVDSGPSTVPRKQPSAPVAAPAAEPVAADAASPWLALRIQPVVAARYLPIFLAILHEGWDAVRPVLSSRFGAGAAAFYSCKIKYYGTGPFTAGKLASFTAWLQEQGGSAESGRPTTEDRGQKTSRKPKPVRAAEPKSSPANTAANAVLSSLADLAGWTEIGRVADAVVSGEVLTLFEGLLDQLMNSPHKRRLLEGKHARVFLAPDRKQLSVAFGAEGIPLAMSDESITIPLRDWSALVGDKATEWCVAEIPATGVVHLVFERSGEGRAA